MRDINNFQWLSPLLFCIAFPSLSPSLPLFLLIKDPNCLWNAWFLISNTFQFYNYREMFPQLQNCPGWLLGFILVYSRHCTLCIQFYPSIRLKLLHQISLYLWKNLTFSNLHGILSLWRYFKCYGREINILTCEFLILFCSLLFKKNLTFVITFPGPWLCLERNETHPE